MTATQPLMILIDADMIVFQASSIVETEIEWDEDLWTLHADAGEAKGIVDERTQSLTNKVLGEAGHIGEYQIIMCFSDTENFRKKLYPPYKANRAGRRKPVCYRAVKEWVADNYTTYQRPGLEADDCIGILATAKPNTIIVSGDKDFKCIPGRFYDFCRGIYKVNTEEEADYWHLFQTLIGDTTDNYPGCPGIGEKTAAKILENEGATWTTVKKQFAKKGLSEQEALTQARVARILRKQDYDFKAKQPKLWEPWN